MTRREHGRDAARASALAVAISLALALVLGAPRSAHADGEPPPPPPPAPQSPEHEAAFKSGLGHFEQADYVGAIKTWESLLATIGEERGYKVLYNLGLAYEAIGDVTHAIERFRAFERQVAERADASADLTARAEDARARATQLETTHGSVHVDPPKRGGLVLTRVGSAEPRTAGYVVWLAPGRHAVEVFVGTDHAHLVTVDVEPGKDVHVDTTPPEEPPRPSAAPSDERTNASTWLAIGAGATIASFALPATLFFVAKGKRDDADALGAGNTAYGDARTSYQTWRSVYFASYALPATLAVATGLAWALTPSRKASVGVSASGVTVSGRF